MSKFREMTEDEKSAWRSLPATQALLEELRGEAEATRKSSLNHSFKGESAQAQALAGSSMATDAAIMLIEMRGKEVISAPADDDFVDPAARKLRSPINYEKRRS